MNRKILVQVAGPIVLIGLLLFGACFIGAWQISRLQSKLGHVLGENLASLRAAQEIETHLRRLRFHCVMYLIAASSHNPPASTSAPPGEDLLEKIDTDESDIEHWLAEARESDRQQKQQVKVNEIETAYHKYLDDFNGLKKRVQAGEKPFRDPNQLLEMHPVQYVIDACEALVEVNKDQTKKAQVDAESVSGDVRLTMLLLGLGGPLSGIIIGYGVARGLSRSIYQLSVRVQNVAQRLDQDVASVQVAADGDIAQMDSQLQHILSRVEEVAQRLQRQQRDMLRAEQLSAVGQLAASVAHEIRNPISGVKLLVEAAQRPRNPLPLTQEDLNVIHDEIERVEQTVQGLLDFARLPSPQLASCDLRTLVAQAANLVSTRARQQHVELIVHNPDEPLFAEVDSNQVGTVLVNLFLNALDAMPQGGKLEVDLDLVDGEIQLVVADTGTGIPPDMFEKLFVPFASSKATGTGLGLSICRRILEEHGGRITAENRPQGGARFAVSLPSGKNGLAASLGERETARSPEARG